MKCFYNQETNIEMSLFCHFEEWYTQLNIVQLNFIYIHVGCNYYTIEPNPWTKPLNQTPWTKPLNQTLEPNPWTKPLNKDK